MAIPDHPRPLADPQVINFYIKIYFPMKSKYEQETYLFEKQIVPLEKSSLYLDLINKIYDKARALKEPVVDDNFSDLSEEEKGKKRYELSIYTYKLRAAMEVIKELEALQAKSERKHREAKQEYDAYCKRNDIH